MIVSKLIISQRSQIIEDTAEPSCLPDKNNLTAWTLSSMTFFPAWLEVEPQPLRLSCAVCTGERISPHSHQGRPNNVSRTSYCQLVVAVWLAALTVKHGNCVFSCCIFVRCSKSVSCRVSSSCVACWYVNVARQQDCQKCPPDCPLTAHIDMC